MEITPVTVEKSENQNENPSNEKQLVEADITSTRDVAAGDAPNNNKNGPYQKKRPYNPAYKRYAIPWVTKFPMALHEEIWSFSQWLTPTTEEQTMRQDVVNRLRKIVEKLWEGATVVPYGSFETNLCVPTSDIDVVIFGAQPIDDRSPLTILAEALEQEELPSKPPKVIASAKVPIVKFHDRKSGCLVDISFDITTGIANTKIIKEFLNQYPLLRPLALVIKFYLKQRYLNDTWSGGIGSYTLIMMIISYLQLHTKSKGQIPQSDDAPNGDGENNNNNNNNNGDNNDVPAPHDETKEDLASMLTGFFELYGSKFDYLTNVISILDGGKYLSKEEKKWVHTDALDALAVEDPQNPDNDVGLACFKIKEAKKAFADAFTMLTGPKKYLSESLLGKLVRVPLSLVQQRQRIKSSSSGRELTDETSEANIETQSDVDPEEKRLTYNYQNRYKSYSRNNDGWYHNKPPTASNNNTNQQSNTNHRAEASADSTTTAQRAPSHNNNNNGNYLPPHRRQQQARAPAPANTNSGGSSTVSSAGTSPTNSTLSAISVPLVVPALTVNSNNNNRNNTQQQRKGSYQNNNNNNNTHQGTRSNNSSHHLNTHKTSSNNTTSHSPASTSPRVTSSNNPSNTPVHSGHNNGNSNNNSRQNSSSQNRSGSNNNNRSNNNRNNNNSNRGRSNHNNHNNNANIMHDDEIKNDELNFPTLSKDPTVHENKIAQKSSAAADTSSNRSQHVNNNTINGNNGAVQQQQSGNNKSDGKKGGKRRQNTVLISA